MYTLQFFYTYRDAFRSLYMKKIVFTFGRFNPPTTGHYLLATRVKEEARKRNAEYRIYGSNTKDPKRNPLTPTSKSKFMKKVLNDRNVVVNKDSGNPYAVLQKLSAEGYSDVTMVVGSDRVPEFKRGIKKYIGKKGYENIKNFEVVSAGDRDPDAEGVEGMSASKMRAAAAEGNIDAFRLGVPSHVSSKDVMDLFYAVRRGMGIRGKIEESWFNYDEFAEFVNEQSELNELTLQARRKLSMRMKKTAKKRARVRKLREKRRKTKVQLVARANKQAIKKIRSRFHKGRSWSEVSFMERGRISEKLKKKKKVIQRISKRLIPAMNKAEKERLDKVRTRMTSKDPVKAIAPTNEHIDIMFEEYLEEIAVPRARPRDKVSSRVAAQDKVNREKQKAQDRGLDAKKVDAARKRGERANGQTDNRSDKQKKFPNLQSNDPVEVQRGDEVEIVLFKDAKIDQIKSSRPVKPGQAKSISNKPGFVCGETAQALGVNCDKVAQAQQAQQGQQTPEQEVNPELQKTSDAQQIAQSKLNTAQSNQQLADLEAQQQQQKDAKEAELAQAYQNPYAQQLGIETKPLPKGKKEKERGDTFPSAGHKAVDAEFALVAAASGCHDLTGKKMKACLDAAKVSTGDQKILAQSLTLTGAGRRMWDTLGKIIPENMKAQHYGKGGPPITLSDTWQRNKAGDKTPKTDLYWEDEKTGESIRASMKIGDGQLMSGGAEESMATLETAMNRMRGCKGVDKNGQGTDCQRNPMSGEAKAIKAIQEIKEDIAKSYDRDSLGAGMGPTSWWLDGGVVKTPGDREPDWWGKDGSPGSKGVKWKDVVGKPPNKADFPNYNEKTIDRLKNANSSHKRIMGNIENLFEESEEFKRHVIYESLTGCGKFCGCCGQDVCNDCQEKAMATHMVTAEKDGTKAALTEIGGPNSPFVTKLLKQVNVSVRLKSSQKISKATGKEGNYSWWSVLGLTTSGGFMGVENVQAFLEFSGDTEHPKNQVKKAMESIGDDPQKLLEFFGAEIEMDVTHGNLADTFAENTSGKHTEIVINGKTTRIPIENPEDYRDYQKEAEEGEDLDESFRVLTEPDILDRLVTQLRDKGMEKNKAYAVATSQLQKRGVLKKGTNDLTAHGEKRDSMGAAGRAKDRAAKKDGKSPKDYNYNPRTNIATQKEDCGCINEDNTAAIAKQVKQAVKKYVTGTPRVQSKGGKVRFIMLRADKIDNKLRKMILDVEHPNAKVRDKNNISYGNISDRIISAGADVWMDALGLKESVQLNECWDTHVQQGYKMKGGKRVPNCVPKGSTTKFGESTTHGIGTFAKIDIQEGATISLYLLDLMENTPTYQRTDFCRFTNHSHKNANITLERIDGSLHATASRDIQEGEEFFMDYFHVLDNIGTDMNIIEDVLRWTEGYENLYIPEDTIQSFAHELSYLVSIGDCPELSEEFLKILPEYTVSEDEDPVKRAKRQKEYNARPEQKARRSSRTNERNKRIRKGQVEIGDGKDIDHKDGNPLNNSSSNISITSANYNRGRNNNKGRTNEEHGAGDMGTKELLKKYLKNTPHMTIDAKFKKEMD